MDRATKILLAKKKLAQFSAQRRATGEDVKENTVENGTETLNPPPIEQKVEETVVKEEQQTLALIQPVIEPSPHSLPQKVEEKPVEIPTESAEPQLTLAPSIPAPGMVSEARLKLVEHNLSNTMAQLASITEERDDLLRQRQAWSQERCDLLAKLETAKQHLVTAIKDKEQLTAALKEKEQTPAKSSEPDSQEILDLRARIDELMTSNRNLQEETVQLNVDLMKALAVTQSTEKVDNTLDSDFARLQQENQALKIQIGQAIAKSHEANSMESRIKEYSEEVARLKKQNWDLEERLRNQSNLPPPPTLEDDPSADLLKIILQLTATNKQLNHKLQLLRGEMHELSNSVNKSSVPPSPQRLK